MITSFYRFIFIVFLFSASIVCVNAQSNTGEKEELPKGIKETLAKNRIDREKKDYEELLQRGEETVKLSEELDKSFVQNKKLTGEDQRKLERLEKLSKKIREELGGSDSNPSSEKENSSDSDDIKLSSVSDAVDKLKNISRKLSDELKKTTRYTISTVAVQSSNALFKVVRFIRLSKN
jgi:hypothetical protein